MKVRVNVRGDDEIARKIATLRAVFPTEVDRALKYEAQDILNASRDNLTPMSDTPDHAGTLRESGKVEYSQRGTGHYAGVAYGGPGSGAEAYAMAVHEEPPSPHHPPSWLAKFARGESLDWTTPGTGHKYLERAVKDAEVDMISRISDRIRTAIANAIA